MFDRLEQVGQCIVAIGGTINRLIDLDVTKMRDQGLKKSTNREQESEACVYCCHRREML